MKTVGLTPTEPTAPRAEMLGVTFSRGWKHSSFRLGITHVCFGATLILLALLSACTSEPSKPAETAPKPAELISARSAFQKVYVAARGWNQDAKPYRLESTVTTDGNGHDGKWAVWRGSFASAAMRSQKSYTWSGSAADGAPERGVNPGIEDTYSPSNASTQVFDIAFLKIDSDQAFATAQQHGGDKILEKEPDTPVFYVCDWNHNTNQLVWHVTYGASREGAKLTVAVDASTGVFLRVEK
ncbi:conserved hypothetical protein [Candidatus Sulfotelmatobacter kueseliae]|uniref:PepSY domain-containing protein n=1 Tax=Candidatus Sulfotelmatobacter kueseliae TaxID=2042962 RepID=A0A2U3L0J8_9BACT|nr:conserved hypothetical protein [Candidatus Sulfotelmatobacter kueseliae]